MTEQVQQEPTIFDCLELRRLVDVLYDIQDVRMRTANRLRSMPKGTLDVHVGPLRKVEEQLTKEIEGLLVKFPIYTDFLYNVKGVGPRISGSIIAQTMIRFVRVPKEEYEKLSQRMIDTQRVRASHRPDEAQERPASHSRNENHEVRASQGKPVTHPFCASPSSDDTHCLTASHQSNDTQLRLAYSKEQLELAQKTENGGYLIPTIRGIQAFDTVSKYWAWWGLHTVDGKAAKRKRGENINWNPKMRTLAWKIGKQFVIQGERYRMYYDQYKLRKIDEWLPLGECPKYDECKAKLKNRKQPACKGHIDAMSRRYAVKMFLSHLWETWRKQEDLPTRPPYVLEYLKHTTKEEPVKN